MRSSTYYKATRLESVDIDEALNAGQVVEPDNDMQEPPILGSWPAHLDDSNGIWRKEKRKAIQPDNCSDLRMAGGLSTTLS